MTSRTTRRIPLEELVDTHPETDCPEGLYLVTDKRGANHDGGDRRPTATAAAAAGVVVDDPEEEEEEGQRRRIPTAIHVTSRSRCVPKPFYDNLRKWRDLDDRLDFYFHNEAAVDRLLYGRDWSEEFPHLRQITQSCLTSGAAKADVWRAVLLWEYGGIYTDVDNAPTSEFTASTPINFEEDEAFFVIESGRFLSQYFMATCRRHPIAFLTVHHALSRILNLNDVSTQYVPFVTGPGALKSAFIHFMDDQGPNNGVDYRPKFSHVTEAGVYRSHSLDGNNWTVTVAGTARASDRYVARNVIPRKHLMYERSMNMTHFSRAQRRRRRDGSIGGGGGRSDDDDDDDDDDGSGSCLQRIYRDQQRRSLEHVVNPEMGR